ncbi:hypothetical protein MGN70_003610 [Eutypa lata]|nr:hypothetical protein MGN70_003610 [Eutypa lata]
MVVSKSILFPGTGMLLMGLEAVREMCSASRQVSSYFIRDAHFFSPIIVGESLEERTEITLHLQPLQKAYEKESTWSDIKIFACLNERWTECFRASIRVEYEDTVQHEVDKGLEKRLNHESIVADYEHASTSCNMSVDHRAFYRHCADHARIKYGEWFQLLQDTRWDGKETAIGSVDVSRSKYRTTSVVHPAVLDSAFQLLLTQRSRGLSEPVPTCVPYHLSSAWISASGWQHPQTSWLRHLTTCKYEPGSYKMEGNVYMLAEDRSPLCVLKRLTLKATSNDHTDVYSGKKFLYGIEWKPQMSMLTPEHLLSVVNPARTCVVDENEVERYRLKLHTVLDGILKMTYKRLPEDRREVPTHVQKYIAWMEYYIKREHVSGMDMINESDLEAQLQEVEKLHGPWKILPIIARNLEAILLGKENPLELIFDTNLAETFYADVFDTMCDDRFKHLLELFTHENPNLRILEVGAGTGGWTKRILSLFGDFEKRNGATCFFQYDYTDISPAFFDRARTQFSDFEGRMSFKPFNIERDALMQGFQLEMYDLVIAGSVFHATSNLARTIKNIRKLLKPCGRLLYLEPVAPEKVSTNFAFGTLPGWWLSTEEERSMGPAIEESAWDQVLRDNGFSGNDLILRDYQTEICHLFSIMVSTAAGSCSSSGQSIDILLVTNGHTSNQISLVQSHQSIFESTNKTGKVISLSQMQSTDLTNADVVISLVELDSPLFANIQGLAYESLKLLVKHCRKLLWISCATINDPMYPYSNLMLGFLRSMRSESFEKHIVTLRLESPPQSSNAIAGYVNTVFHASFESTSTELDYVLREGTLLTGRLVEEVHLNTTLVPLLCPQIKHEAWMPGPAIKLTVGTPGMLDTLHFVKDAEHDSPLEPEEVEIETRAWGLNFRDVFVALGRLEGSALGSDCAGIVTRKGSTCKAVNPSDRVLMAVGSMRTYCKARELSLTKIPDHLSLKEAVSIITPGITAYYSLIYIARLRKGDKILIHSATGATGQMAIWVAKMVGAEIFATVGLDSKRQLLMDNFGLPYDHIFYSRNTTFAEGIMRVTKGYGVDVILNSLSGESLKSSLDCLSSSGRFIEIGKADIVANSPLPMASLAKNISFSVVDLFHISQTNLPLIRELQEIVLDLTSQGAIRGPSPLHSFSVSNIEQAFRYVQSGRNTGRTIINVERPDIVPVSNKRVY